jgi:hypothetical protein
MKVEKIIRANRSSPLQRLKNSPKGFAFCPKGRSQPGDLSLG